MYEVVSTFFDDLDQMIEGENVSKRMDASPKGGNVDNRQVEARSRKIQNAILVFSFARNNGDVEARSVHSSDGLEKCLRRTSLFQTRYDVQDAVGQHDSRDRGKKDGVRQEACLIWCVRVQAVVVHTIDT